MAKKQTMDHAQLLVLSLLAGEGFLPRSCF